MEILYDTVWEQKGPYTQRKTTFNTKNGVFLVYYEKYSSIRKNPYQSTE